MSFISYAQNFEDVMLWRALQSVEKGFYIDVGANDPVEDSVTKAFYDRGWRGINIEPVPSHWRDLIAARPEDINLQCAVGSEDGALDLWESDVRGWASGSPDVIAQHEAEGHTGKMINVPVHTLTDICAAHRANGDIHFLKIDVEGFEAAVIEGMDFSRFRPWILVVEATRPNSTEEIHQQWESSVLEGKYRLAYVDGLNRFYVAEERPELAASLRYPPNVLDAFKSVDLVRAETRVHECEQRQQQVEQQLLSVEQSRDAAEQQRQVVEQQQALVGQLQHLVVQQRLLMEQPQQSMQQQLQALEQQRQSTEQRLQQVEATLQQTGQKLHEAESRVQELAQQKSLLDQQLQMIYASTSWRVTSPLRSVTRKLFAHGLKATFWSTVRRTVKYVNRHPRLKNVALRFLNHVPGLKHKLRKVMGLVEVAPMVAMEDYDSYTSSNLTAQASRIYDELQASYIKRAAQEKQ